MKPVNSAPCVKLGGHCGEKAIAAIDLARTDLLFHEQDAEAMFSGQRQGRCRTTDTRSDNDHVPGFHVAGTTTFTDAGSQRSSSGVVASGRSPSRATGSCPSIPTMCTHGV